MTRSTRLRALPVQHAFTRVETPEEFFELVFREHYSFVHRALRALGVPPEMVDDAAQEVFIVVHRRLQEFDRRGPLRAWLYGVTRRVAHDVRRGRARRGRRLALVEQTPERRGPDDVLARREAAAFIGEFLETLDAAQREVFVLMELEGFSAPETSELTGMKLNTVYSRLRKARKRLERAVHRRQARERRECGEAP